MNHEMAFEPSPTPNRHDRSQKQRFARPLRVSELAGSERACLPLFRGAPTDGRKQPGSGKQGTGNAVARELDQLRKKVKELTFKLEREAKARKLDARLAAEAKSARAQLSKELTALRAQGRKLAAQLKSTLGDAGKREQALKEARTKVVELKAEPGRKIADLRRKSGELKQLAEESAHRAAAIIRGDAQHAAKPLETEPAVPPAPSEPGSESPSSNKSTPT